MTAWAKATVLVGMALLLIIALLPTAGYASHDPGGLTGGTWTTISVPGFNPDTDAAPGGATHWAVTFGSHHDGPFALPGVSDTQGKPVLDPSGLGWTGPSMGSCSFNHLHNSSFPEDSPPYSPHGDVDSDCGHGGIVYYVQSEFGSFFSQIFVAKADVGVTKTGPGIASVGQAFTYEMTVTNHGPNDATGVLFLDSLLGNAYVELIGITSSQGTCGLAIFVLACDIGDMAPGAEVKVTLTVLPRRSGSLTNFAAVQANEQDDNPGNDKSDPLTTTVYLPEPSVPSRSLMQPQAPILNSSGGDGPWDGGLSFYYDLQDGLDRVNGFDGLDLPIILDDIEYRTGDQDASVIKMPGIPKYGNLTPKAPEQSSQPSPQDVGDPIFLHSGEFSLSAEDLRIPGRGFDWTFTRTYLSGIQYDGPLGHNWDFTYNRRLVLVTEENLPAIPTGAFTQELSPGDVIRMDGRGRVDLYKRLGDGSFKGPAGFYTSLTISQDGGFAVRDFAGYAEFYSPPDPQSLARLMSLRERNGNTMRFAYNAAGQLVETIDTLGRSIGYSYNSDGRLVRVRDFIGRSITFAYDGNGNLIEVTSPAVTGTPNKNDFPLGKTVRYSYSSGFQDPRLNHNMISVTAANEVASGGPPRLTLVYDNDQLSPDADRVVSLSYGGTNGTGVPAGGLVTFDYESLSSGGSPGLNDAISQTTVTDRNDNVTEYRFNALGNSVSVREFTNRGIRSSDAEFYETRFQHNKDGKVVRVEFPEGNVTQYTYDEKNPDRLQQGNLLSRVLLPDARRGGDQTAIKTVHTYEPVYNQIRTVIEARGNESGYVPQNAAVATPQRYTTTNTFDYEEACDLAAIGANTGRTAAEIAALFTRAGMCTASLGDANGDGLVDQPHGNIIRTQYPSVRLFARSNQATVGGSTSQPIASHFTYNRHGQITQLVDPEGNRDVFEYHPESDPDGDGLDPTPAADPGPFGYLRQVTRDVAQGPRSPGSGLIPPASI